MTESAAAADDSFVDFARNGRLAYQPGLDGLRGLAVAAVVAFHLDIPAVGGGYLGVSLFFTLSGVLIGSLLLAEIAATGRFDPSRFARRRGRRLLPAALTIVALVALGRLVTTRLSATSGADVLSSLANVANWHFLADEQSYAELFAAPSAVLHFWSLAIEWQLYLLVAAAAFVAARSRRPALLLGVAAGAGALISYGLGVAAPALGWSVDRVYYGTDTRAGELLAGVALAAIVSERSRRITIIRHRTALGIGGTFALVATVALWATVDAASPALRHGLLIAVAGLSLIVILATLVGAGPLASAAGLAPLRALGTISYPLYLVHWPVFVVAEQLGGARLPRMAAATAVAVALATALALLVERPLRRRQPGARRLAAVGAVAVLAIAASSAVSPRRTAGDNLLAALDVAADEPTTAGSAADDAGRTAPVRVGFYGDSIAFSLHLGLSKSSVQPRFAVVASETDIGCGIALSPWPPPEEPGRCDARTERFATIAGDRSVEVAVLMSCQWELLDQRLPGGAARLGPGDTVFDDYVRVEFAAVTQRLLDAGIERVLWVRCPYFGPAATAGVPAELVAARQPERVDRLNAILDDLATAPHVGVVAFDSWVNDHDDPTIRPDGAHFDFQEPNAGVDEFVAELNAAL